MANKKQLKSKRSSFRFGGLAKGGLTIIISVLVIFTVVKAGTLTPPSGTPSAQFYTLSEIYEFITNNTTATEGGHDFTFADTLTGTGKTLTEIYDVLAGLITANTVKLGTTYLGTAGTLTPDGGTAAITDVFNGKTVHISNDWTLDTGTLNLACNVSTFDGTENLVATAYDGDGDGTNRWCMTNSGDATGEDILTGKTAWVNGSEVSGSMTNNSSFSLTASTTDQSVTVGYYSGGTLLGDADLIVSNILSGVNIFGVIGELVAGYLFGDSDATKVLTTATGAGTYDASNLSTATVKKGTTFGVSSTGAYIGYPGSGWTGTTITQAACDAENGNGWYWFADGNGDGDTTDPEDGVCIKTTTVTSNSWNGAEQVGPTVITAQAATGGSAATIVKDSAGWTVNAYADAVVDITSGTASGCWGVIKSNTADTLTVYGSWLDSSYASSCGTPDATSVFSVEDDGFSLYDNSWIGDWSCTGSFPSGTVVFGSYPTSGIIALAEADCYDGTRDLLPNEIDRAVKTGTATAADASSITDSSLVLNTNAWVGQKVLITGGTGADGWGRIESNTATAITIDSWTGGSPAVDSTFAIIYLIPHATYNPTTDVTGSSNDIVNGNNGPLTAEVLNNWKGTRLPSSSDFFGFCGYKDGGSNYENTTGTYTADKTYGNYGGQVGRTDEFIDLANSSWEWLSEQRYYYHARIAGGTACSYFGNSYVYYGYSFRAVFRP